MGLGDFNVALNISDCSDVTAAKDIDMEDFRNCVDSLELEDIASKGMFYTWIQKRIDPESGILKKLDRALGNVSFISCYDSCFAEFLPYLSSDHCPVVLNYSLAKPVKPRPFRFANFLADKDSFIPTVRDNWGIEVFGFRMFVLAKRMKNMKRHLRKSLIIAVLDMKSMSFVMHIRKRLGMRRIFLGRKLRFNG